jgi:hypothetical protein
VSWSGTAVGSGAFTFECWFYSTDFSAAQTLIGTTDSAGLSIRLGSTNVSVDRYNQGADNFSTPSTLNTNTWYHIAVTRDSGGTMTVFVNGTRSPTGTALTTADFKTVKYLGTLNPSDSYPVIGGMSNARLVVGSNVYNPASSTITVPTSALTAVTNTKLLTLQNSTLIDNSTNAYTLTYTGFTPGVVYGYVSSFDSNGFTTAAGSTSNSEYNLNNRDFVGWFWKKGATPGFDIVTYTGTGSGRTIAHSLGATPAFIIVKNRSATSQWIVWHKVFDNNNYLQLNATAAAQNGGTSMWNSSAHTSSVFSIGTDGAVNTNGQSYVAYLWSEVAGFSKFGSYAANASTDGPFVYCGFKPRWIMIKRYDSSGPAWRCYDTARKSYNPQGFDAYMNATTEETSNAYFDVTSNGFKIRTTDGDLNASGGSYIFMAFADEPFRTATAHSDANKTTAVSLTAPTSVDYLVVAGGAGGGAINDVSGGGGGGGVRYGSVSVSTGIAYTATVGGGGTGAVNGTGAASTNGTNSSLSGSGLTTINASGGGAGGSWDSSGSSGGCGGGAAGKAAGGALSGSSGNAGAYSPVEGYNGGGSLHTPGVNAGGGGGGGAGAIGQTAPSISQGGSGGAGYLWSNGSYYGGGGGGASTQSGVAGAGGAGGGGAGVAGGLGASGSSATVNTGGGGGAGRRGNGGDGGSGIIIIRYPDSFKTATSTTGSPTVTISGGYRYYTFTGTGTITF